MLALSTNRKLCSETVRIKKSEHVKSELSKPVRNLLLNVADFSLVYLE